MLAEDKSGRRRGGRGGGRKSTKSGHRRRRGRWVAAAVVRAAVAAEASEAGTAAARAENRMKTLCAQAADPGRRIQRTHSRSTAVEREVESPSSAPDDLRARTRCRAERGRGDGRGPRVGTGAAAGGHLDRLAGMLWELDLVGVEVDRHCLVDIPPVHPHLQVEAAFPVVRFDQLRVAKPVGVELSSPEARRLKASWAPGHAAHTRAVCGCFLHSPAHPLDCGENRCFFRAVTAVPSACTRALCWSFHCRPSPSPIKQSLVPTTVWTPIEYGSCAGLGFRPSLCSSRRPQRPFKRKASARREKARKSCEILQYL